jgi:hypothetical protein
VGGLAVTLDGTLTKINSGPGTPAAAGQPRQAVTPTAPSKAEDADDADPGGVAETKARQRELKAGKYGAVPVKPYKPPTEDEKEQKRHWIEIEMVDEVDKPMAGVRFAVTLPDGETVAEGTLDENGFKHIDGIEKPGMCQITFPDLDWDAWEWA